MEVQDWTLCASGLDFPYTGLNGPWPASCSGNVLTWLIPEDCQKHTVPGYEDKGVLAVAGVFRLVAHSPDELRIAYHPGVPIARSLSVMNCAGNNVTFGPETDTQMGSVSFGGYPLGVDPCLGYVFHYGTAMCPDHAPVLPVTWGRIKSLYR